MGNVPSSADEMKRYPNFVGIFNQAIDKYETYAHELGHNRTLEHPFDYTNQPLSKYSTSNIMDYRVNLNRNMFFKAQTKIIYYNLKEDR